MISIIAAIGKNNEIGKKNKLLWHLPADMKHFREITSGRTVIMGQKTFESIGNRPLPNRRNIVLTKDASFVHEGIEIVHSLEELDNLLKKENDESIRLAQDKEVFIFNNRGGKAGASILHAHSQIVAAKGFPGIIEKEKESALNVVRVICIMITFFDFVQDVIC